MKTILTKKEIIIISIIFIFITIIAVFFIISNNNHNKTQKKNYTENYKSEKKLVLFGSDLITLKNGEKYQEPGYYAVTENDIIDSSNVIVIGNDFDTTIAGNYTITYQYKNLVKIRTITVLEKEPELENEIEDILKLTLKGDEVITLEVGDKYDEPGYEATYNDLNVNNLVSVISDLNINKTGTYTITYTIIYKEQIKEITRNVIVVDNNLTINLTKSNSNYTNTDVNINVNIEGNSFAYLVLPNNTVTENKNTTYKVNENGTYIFKGYNKNGKEFQETIIISNIDKMKPTGTCIATLNKNNTIIKVNATDNNKITNYIYYDNNKQINQSTNSNYTYNQKTSKNILVKVIDLAGNSSNITCQIIDNSYEDPILPSSTENVVFKGETDTLKVYISKYSSYHLTRVWMKNPYTQVNKYDCPSYGKSRCKTADLLSQATNSYNLKNKIVIGFNASGMYSKSEGWDEESVKAYKAYNETSVGTLVITNGKVIRNVYDKGDRKTWFITGINKDNKMLVFEDTKMKETTVQEKKKWSESVINSGIRNTFTFAAPVILNGQKTNPKDSKYSAMPDNSNKTKKGLQLLCQINDNNFVLFTGNTTRNTAIDKFMQLGCKTAVNLDGGGSIYLFYKEKNSDNFVKLRGGNRTLTEIGLFTE